DGDARKTGKQLLEQLESLALLLGHLHRHSGDVAARARKAGNNPGADWISGGHHDRYGVSCFVRGQAGRGTPGHDHVDRKIHQLGRERRKSLGVPLRKTIHEEMSLSFDIAEVAQAVQRWPVLVRENTDFPKASGRLRKGSAKPRNDRAAADKFNKLTPPELTKLHLIIPAMMAVGAAYRIAADQSVGRASGHAAAA